MKKKLRNALEQIKAGLAHQHSADFLTMQQKMDLLGYEVQNRQKTQQTISGLPGMAKASTAKTIRRIALVSNGIACESALHYSIEASQRQGAELDLLIHHESDENNVIKLQEQIREAGINSQLIQLGENGAKDLVDYIVNQTKLIFLVAIPDDMIVRTLVDDVMPQSKQRFPVPLVLIDNMQTQKNYRTDNNAVA